jgi:hypothetical protein
MRVIPGFILWQEWSQQTFVINLTTLQAPRLRTALALLKNRCRGQRRKQEFINKTLTLIKMSYGIVC